MANKKSLLLAACPFCGGEARLIRLWTYVKKDGTTGIAVLDGEEPWQHVRCQICGASSKTLPRQEAVTAWNRRAPAENRALRLRGVA